VTTVLNLATGVSLEWRVGNWETAGDPGGYGLTPGDMLLTDNGRYLFLRTTQGIAVARTEDMAWTRDGSSIA
jgi:hypothetical protein